MGRASKTWQERREIRVTLEREGGTVGETRGGGGWAAVQQGLGILGPSSGEGEAAGFRGVIERVLVSK